MKRNSWQCSKDTEREKEFQKEKREERQKESSLLTSLQIPRQRHLHSGIMLLTEHLGRCEGGHVAEDAATRGEGVKGRAWAALYVGLIGAEDEGDVGAS